MPSKIRTLSSIKASSVTEEKSSSESSSFINAPKFIIMNEMAHLRIACDHFVLGHHGKILRQYIHVLLGMLLVISAGPVSYRSPSR